MDRALRLAERNGDENAARVRERAGLARRIDIDGETFTVLRVRELGHGELSEIDTAGGKSFILSSSREEAGRAARARWEEMARTDPGEFRAIVGDQALVAWALGQPASPGSREVSSLNEWLDLWLDIPQEEWACYDGKECDVDDVSLRLVEELGWRPSVAYRTN